ncbi:MAG: hypothetical protein LBE59_09975 [Nevskiaceae bacterium]|jgi:hypothetical protein|nr:hypothetical protein [Nevskiaceae bacterium]
MKWMFALSIFVITFVLLVVFLLLIGFKNFAYDLEDSVGPLWFNVILTSLYLLPCIAMAYWSFHWRVSMTAMGWTVGIVALVVSLLCFLAYNFARNVGNFRIG